MDRTRDKDEPLGIEGLIGLGFDGDDGHVRISRGKNFYLVGGSEVTHEEMQETALKFNEKVDERGKKLREINGHELDEIVKDLRKG